MRKLECDNTDTCAGEGATQSDLIALYVNRTVLRSVIAYNHSKTLHLSKTDADRDIARTDTLVPYPLHARYINKRTVYEGQGNEVCLSLAKLGMSSYNDCFITNRNQSQNLRYCAILPISQKIRYITRCKQKHRLHFVFLL